MFCNAHFGPCADYEILELTMFDLQFKLSKIKRNENEKKNQNKQLGRYKKVIKYIFFPQNINNTRLKVNMTRIRK